MRTNRQFRTMLLSERDQLEASVNEMLRKLDDERVEEVLLASKDCVEQAIASDNLNLRIASLAASVRLLDAYIERIGD